MQLPCCGQFLQFTCPMCCQRIVVEHHPGRPQSLPPTNEEIIKRLSASVNSPGRVESGTGTGTNHYSRENTPLFREGGSFSHSFSLFPVALHLQRAAVIWIIHSYNGRVLRHSNSIAYPGKFLACTKSLMAGRYLFRLDFRIILSSTINLFKFPWPCYSE